MTAERVYRLLLRVYPRDFRTEYGREMTLLFRDEYRTREATALSFWASMVWDAAHSAMSEWVDVWLARGKEYTRTFEVIMKLAGTLAVLFGVYGALSALAEGMPGTRGTLGGAYLLAILLSGAAGALLITAGVALWRSKLGGRQTATIALTASLVIIVIARLTFPWMSIFSQLIGIGMPIVLLSVLYWPRRRGPSTTAAV
jgi:hypothetical protein